jgi:uracil-DNA glycosylase
MDVRDNIAACRICAARFAATATRHAPCPVVWFNGPPRILIASQAPGARVHAAQTPFWDRSGDRLRDWLGIGHDDFYDRDRVAIVPWRSVFRATMPQALTCRRPGSAPPLGGNR